MRVLNCVLTVIFILVTPVNLLAESLAERSFYEALPLVVHPADNPWSKEKEDLGKMLYFDPRLSGSNWSSCATCHNPHDFKVGGEHGSQEQAIKSRLRLNNICQACHDK